MEFILITKGCDVAMAHVTLPAKPSENDTVISKEVAYTVISTIFDCDNNVNYLIVIS